MKHPIVNWFLNSFLLITSIFLLIQLFPYGHNHTNPPIVLEPPWDTVKTRQTAISACFDCHSNETFWPWYSNLAPASWLIQYDVEEGRRHLNFSDWKYGQREGERYQELREELKEGDMPPLIYRTFHPQARLTPSEKNDFLQGLKLTVSQPMSQL